MREWCKNSNKNRSRDRELSFYFNIILRMKMEKRAVGQILLICGIFSKALDAYTIRNIDSTTSIAFDREIAYQKKNDNFR